MPELPDITVYVEAMEARIAGETVTGVRVPSVSFLRTAEPPIEDAIGRRVEHIERSGKRVVLTLARELILVIHLMIAGRFQWRPARAAVPRKRGLAAIDFAHGTLLITEASSQKRASIHVLQGRDALAAHERSGVEVLECTLEAFTAALMRKNHTLKRAMTSPAVFSGIGNAYSDEILHRARLSPLTWTCRLDDEEVKSLWLAAQEVLREWTERLRTKAGDKFPSKVTAFHPEMAVHGKYGKPCPACGAPVQRIVYGARETNYCAPCQTDGKVYADRALSKLLKADWPRSIDGWETLKGRQ